MKRNKKQYVVILIDHKPVFTMSLERAKGITSALVDLLLADEGRNCTGSCLALLDGTQIEVEYA